ncbi:dihydroxyacetone kinase subunit DhaL [Kitasatospora sp. DSM 101779]|uniref:dihydroxyacetone kinase subunit DhaL n=1 Tax=Kitasatospora sp. DSM 101779 TaxID=2853165 RepID=UPI0021D9C20A|nr:dihydroxyacetone kinase subunit DhaL [Kitasatospora sp. DSM 101779]MCU7822501.1 dihydroxyacetone kinase subunit L [Kitasatospora sp. DSM 101779]
MELDTARTEAWLRAAAAAVTAREAELTALDTAIGDGDHGSNLRRGFTAVLAGLDAEKAGGTAAADRSPGILLAAAGRTLISTVGGASGPLYGSALRAAGRALPGASAGPDEVAAALGEALGAVRSLGGAQPGDKTMVDAWAPAAATFAEAAGQGLAAASAAAAAAAEQGARATLPLVARKGRASYLGPRSAGHLDPGAVSTALLFAALAEACRER